MRVAGFLLLGALLTGAAGTYWLDGLFEEPGAREIESLAAELGSEVWLAAFAHPDDEITAAGALADASQRGVRVHVVTATHGENGTPDVPVSGPEELGRMRASEVRAHGRALGFAEHLVWTYPDGQVRDHQDEVARALEEVLARVQPDTVLTFHPGSGFTAHPDHRAVGAAATGAAAFAAPAAKVVYILAPRSVMRFFGGEDGALVAEHQPPANVYMPIDRALKLRGWEIHASQRDHTRRAFGLPAELLYRLFDEEHYLVP